MSKDKTLILLGSVFTIAGALIVSLLSIAASIKDSIIIMNNDYLITRFNFLGDSFALVLIAFFFIGLIMFVAGLIILIAALVTALRNK